MERVALSSTSHKWDIKSNLTDHTYYGTIDQNNAIFQGFDVSAYNAEYIVYVPNTTTEGTNSTDTSVSVNLGDGWPSGGFDTSWGYDLPDIIQTFNGSGTSTAGWNYAFTPNTPASRNGNSFSPGLSLNNGSGRLLVPIDDKLSMKDYSLGTVWTTGDQYYTINVPDWGN